MLPVSSNRIHDVISNSYGGVTSANGIAPFLFPSFHTLLPISGRNWVASEGFTRPASAHY
jgi:hypothetical protein